MRHEEPLINPIWAIRVMPWLATVLVAISFFARDHEVLRSAATGGALGMLIGVCVFSFQIKAVILKETVQPSDVEHNPIT